jgi:hypothetical protein
LAACVVFKIRRTGPQRLIYDTMPWNVLVKTLWRVLLGILLGRVHLSSLCLPTKGSNLFNTVTDLTLIQKFSMSFLILLYIIYSSNSSTRIVKWVTKNNRLANIVKDRELRELLTAGRPHIKLPSPDTMSHDIKASFNMCRECIATLLHDHPGRLHFATDAWTSPNHRAFVAWTVHLEYEGTMLAFLLDIIEVPEVRTSFTTCNTYLY